LPVNKSGRACGLLAAFGCLFVSSTLVALAQNASPPPSPGPSTPAQVTPSTTPQTAPSTPVQTTPSTPAQTTPSTSAQTTPTPPKPAAKPKPKPKPTNTAANPPSTSGTALPEGVALPQITVRSLSVMTPPPSRPTTQGSGQAVVFSPTTTVTPSDESASSTTVITASDIESRQLRTVPDVLATVPGLNVVQSGGPGDQTSVFIRGTNSNHVKVLIDGIDVSDPSNPPGSYDFGQLLTGDIERIEILRGPQSGLYGSDAIGGVISITTKSGYGPPRFVFSTEGGSFGTTNERAGLSGSQGDFNYVFNVQHFQSASTPVTPASDLAPGEQRNNDFYDNWTYSTKLGYKVTDNFAVNVVGRYTDSKLHFTGDDFVDFFPLSFAEPIQSQQVDHQFAGRAEAVWSPTAALKNFFGVNYSNSWTWELDPNMDTGFVTPTVLPPMVNLGTRTKEDYRGELQVAPGQLFVFGAEDQNETLRTNSSSIIDPTFCCETFFITNAERRNDAGWLELQNQLTRQFSIVSNVRYDANEDFGDHTTFRVAPVYVVPQTDTKLKASYGTGFKAPPLVDLYVNFLPGFLANPDLKPEESKGWDIGFEQPLANDSFRFGSTYFRNDINNLIEAVITQTPGVESLANIEEASTFGFENFAAWRVNSRLNFRADYTYTVAKVDESNSTSCTIPPIMPPCDGQQLVRRPKNKASLTTNWQATERLSLSSTLLYVGPWWDITRQTTAPDGFNAYVKAPGFTTVNLAANYALRDDVTLFARIDNLFNAQYEDPLGFMHPGFGAYAGIRLTAGGLPSSSSAPDGLPGVAPPNPSPRSAGVN
jgi:vitamin B12 transporter